LVFVRTGNWSRRRAKKAARTNERLKDFRVQRETRAARAIHIDGEAALITGERNFLLPANWFVVAVRGGRHVP
jgi:hypothetical protein